jgi:hypothetical protein
MVCSADKNSFLAMNADQYKIFGMYLHNHSFGYSD